MRLVKDHYRTLIEPWIASIEKSSRNAKEKKKITLELYHYAAFCIALLKSNYIKSYQEISLIKIPDPPLPDFEIEFRNSKIGLEICRVTNSKVRRINCQKGILKSTEDLLKTQHPDFKGHLNINFNEFNVESHEKRLLCQELMEFILNYNREGSSALEYPSFIKRISFIPFDSISLNLSGSYWVGDLNQEIQIQIQKKNARTYNYRSRNQYAKVWLLLVIHGNSPESDFNKLDDEVFNIPSKFDCIWILNEFEKRIYHIGNI